MLFTIDSYEIYITEQCALTIFVSDVHPFPQMHLL